MSRNARMTLLGAAVMVAVLAFVVFGTGGDDEDEAPATTPTTAAPTAAAPAPPPRPRVPVVRLRDGKSAGGVAELEFRSGDRARFVVASDTAQEIHFHGYDITRDVPAGGRVTFSFRAEAQGAFEVEVHGTGEQIATVKVVP